MGSLRNRILGTHVLLVAIALLLAGAVTVLLLGRYQREATLSRRRALATVIAADLKEVQTGQREPFSSDTLRFLRGQALALGGRFLLTNAQGIVLQDTAQGEASLVGRRVRLAPPGARAAWRRYPAPDGLLYYFTQFPLPSPAGQDPQRYLILAVAAANLIEPVRDLLAPLGVAGLVALLLSVIAALFLSRSITGPIRALTRATDEIAQGHYDQRVPVLGEDELARLGRRFNMMAGEVQRARQTERDFITNVTHDLRTPLTSILGFAQALLDGAVEDPESYRRSAAIIHDEAGHMRRLIDDLLDLARFEAGAASLSLEPLAPGPWLRAISERFAPRAQAAGLIWQSQLSEPLPPIRADARRLEQAINNLLDNAFKFAAAASGAQGRIVMDAFQVQARGRRFDPPLAGELVAGTGAGLVAAGTGAGLVAAGDPLLRDGTWLAIRIADNGRGIAAEDRKRIFERFFRADKARTETSGSGLGLSIVREIVLAHGGRIAVQSTLGQGAAFTLLLPAG